MSRLVVCLLALASFVSLAPQAAADDVNGLYEPFPGRAATKRAQRYVARLAERPAVLEDLSERELNRGVFVGAPSPAAASEGPSARASGGESSLWWPLQLGLLLLPLAGGLALAARRR